MCVQLMLFCRACHAPPVKPLVHGNDIFRLFYRRLIQGMSYFTSEPRVRLPTMCIAPSYECFTRCW